MIPNKSNTTNGCDNTSSNCVVWQGPDLTCVDVCNGDTVSDVIAKLCETLANTTTEASGVNIDTINQLCIETGYGRANTIQELIQNIINEVCSHNSSESDPCSCEIPLPECLKYTDDQGNQITSLPLYDGKSGESYAVYLANVLCGQISSINQIQNDLVALDGRVTTLESHRSRTSYTPPLGMLQYVAPTKTPMSLERMISLTEQSYGETSRALGSKQDMNKSIGFAQNNLASLDKLNGNGTYSSQPGWITSPQNVAQSFQNLWLTTNDIRSAVESIKETVANPLCSSITNSVTANIKRTDAGVFQSFQLDFTGSTIPTGYVACNGNGTKVTITDASLNTIVKYVDVVSHYQNTDVYTIPTSEFGNLDIGSNYSVKVEFCYENSDNQCAETLTFNVENKTACPNLTIGTVTGDTIPFSITSPNLPSSNGYTLTVSLSTNGGSLIDSRSTTRVSESFTGTFSGLTGSTQYRVGIQISKEGSTAVQECPDQRVSTIAPICVSEVLSSTSTRWISSTTLGSATSFITGGEQHLLGTRYDGTNKLTWTAGFNPSNQLIVVYESTADTTTAAAIAPTGSNVDNQNATTPIICGGDTIPVSGGITQASKLGSGWRYIGSLTSSAGNKHYVFAELNIDTNSVSQVYFCCDCSQLSLTIPQPVYYAQKNSAISIPVTAVGSISGNYTWTVSTSPTHGNVAIATSPAQTGNSATFTYTPSSPGQSFTYDAFSVTLTNDCGTSTILSIPIVRNFSLAHTDTDVTVMIDSASVSLTDALSIKTCFENVKALMKSNNSNWTGTFNYVAINSASNRSGDYLKHIMGMVENIGTATAPTNPALDVYTSGTWYTQFMASGSTLPSYWSGATAAYPSSVFVISFVNTTNSTGTYGAATLGSAPAAWSAPTQPSTNGGSGSTKYQEDYDALIDITSGLAPTSAWGIEASGAINSYWTPGSQPFTFKHVVVNKITGGTNVSAAAALQMASAITGPADLTVQEYVGMKIGGPVYPVNLSTYLLTGVSATPNPYNNSVTTAAGNVLSGLQETFEIAAHMYIENGVVWDTDDNKNMKRFMLGMVGQVENSSVGTPTKDSALKIGGTTAVFGSGASSALACSNAASTSPAIWSAGATVANGIPATPFIGTVLTSRAYTTQSAATNGQSEYELIHGTYYAIYLASGTRYVALYRTTANLSGEYWESITTC